MKLKSLGSSYFLDTFCINKYINILFPCPLHFLCRKSSDLHKHFKCSKIASVFLIKRYSFIRVGYRNIYKLVSKLVLKALFSLPDLCFRDTYMLVECVLGKGITKKVF